MTSIGASAQVDYLVESMLIPNKAIKEGYHALKVTTLDGKVSSASSSARAGRQDLSCARPRTRRSAIAEEGHRREGAVAVAHAGRAGRPAHPAGVRRPGPVPVRTRQGRARTPRTRPGWSAGGRCWNRRRRTSSSCNERGPPRPSRPRTPSCGPSAYSKTSGEFPRESLPKLVVWTGSEPFGLVRAQLDVTTGGPVKLKINGAPGLTLWVGATPAEVKDETVLDLKPGLQTLTFSIDLNKRKDGLRVELEDVAGSPARVNIVGGK